MQVRGVDLAVRESGRGRPFFWGHGLLGCMAQEDDAGLLDWVAIARAARLIRYDARGHGGSEATIDPADYRWTELARDLWALADARDTDTAVLGGLSMGCATTLHAAVAAPHRVEALVLVAPPTAWTTRSRQATIYRVLAAVIERIGLVVFRCMAALGSFSMRNAPHLASLQSSMVDHLRRADPRAVVAALRGAAASDLPEAEALRALDMPALVLTWHGDPSHPVSTAERLVELLPRSELRVARSFEDLRTWSPTISEFLGHLESPRSSSAPAQSD